LDIYFALFVLILLRMSGFDKQLKRLMRGKWNPGFDRDFLKRARYFKENYGLKWVANCDEVPRMQLPTKGMLKTKLKGNHKCHCCQRKRSIKKSFAAWNGQTRTKICKECRRWIKFAENNADKVHEVVKKLTKRSDLLTMSNTKHKIMNDKNKADARPREMVLKKVQARVMARKIRQDRRILLGANHSVLKSPGLGASMAPGQSYRGYGQQGYGKATSNAGGPRDRRYEQAGYRKASDSLLINDKRVQPESNRNPKCTTDSLLINDKRFHQGGIRNPICL